MNKLFFKNFPHYQSWCGIQGYSRHKATVTMKVRAALQLFTQSPRQQLASPPLPYPAAHQRNAPPGRQNRQRRGVPAPWLPTFCLGASLSRASAPCTTGWSLDLPPRCCCEDPQVGRCSALSALSVAHSEHHGAPASTAAGTPITHHHQAPHFLLSP